MYENFKQQFYSAESKVVEVRLLSKIVLLRSSSVAFPHPLHYSGAPFLNRTNGGTQQERKSEQAVAANDCIQVFINSKSSSLAGLAPPLPPPRALMIFIEI